MCVAVIVASALETEFGVRRAAARSDANRMALAEARLSRIGRDSPVALAILGTLRTEAGELDQAQRHLERSLDLYETQLFVRHSSTCFRNCEM